MLSTKVIYAIEVLAELANANPNRMGKRVVKRSDIEKRCDMDKTVSACVFNTLTKYEYISRSTTGYSPVKSLHNVTLYEIIASFHGGVIIGELMDTLFCRGNYRRNPTYAKLAAFEKDLNSELVSRFKKIKIADLAAEQVQS